MTRIFRNDERERTFERILRQQHDVLENLFEQVMSIGRRAKSEAWPSLKTLCCFLAATYFADQMQGKLQECYAGAEFTISS